MKTLEGEIWLPIVNYVGKYEVSSLGRIKSLQRLDSVERWRPGIILKQRMNTKTRMIHVFLSKDGVLKQFRVHRLVCTAFHENPFLLPEVNHKNGDREDNSAENLEWNSREQNMNHAKINGLCARGERNRWAKITDKVALEIFNEKGTITEIASKRGLDVRQIHEIKSGQYWGWLTGKEYTPVRRKLSRKQVISIFGSSLSLNELSKKHNCSIASISLIRHGKMYAAITKTLTK